MQHQIGTFLIIFLIFWFLLAYIAEKGSSPVVIMIFAALFGVGFALLVK